MPQFTKFEKHTKAPKIKYTGVFDFDSVYSSVVDKFKDMTYTIIEKKNIQKGGSSGVEVETELYASRIESEYIKFEITCFIKAFDLVDVEVEKNNNRIKKNQGRLLIDFQAVMITDWQNILEKATFLKKLRHLYETKVIKSALEGKYEDMIFYEMYKVHAAVKKALEKYTDYNAY